MGTRGAERGRGFARNCGADPLMPIPISSVCRGVAFIIPLHVISFTPSSHQLIHSRCGTTLRESEHLLALIKVLGLGPQISVPSYNPPSAASLYNTVRASQCNDGLPE